MRGEEITRRLLKSKKHGDTDQEVKSRREEGREGMRPWSQSNPFPTSVMKEEGPLDWTRDSRRFLSLGRLSQALVRCVLVCVWGGGVVTMDDEKPMNAVLMAAAKQVFGVRLSLCEERWWFVCVCVCARAHVCGDSCFLTVIQSHAGPEPRYSSWRRVLKRWPCPAIRPDSQERDSECA